MTPIVHPNVHARTGEICLDVLHAEWSPSWTLLSSCLAILVLLERYVAAAVARCRCLRLLLLALGCVACHDATAASQAHS